MKRQVHLRYRGRRNKRFISRSIQRLNRMVATGEAIRWSRRSYFLYPGEAFEIYQAVSR